jgi:succinate dehydrogenase hydrophobic anchor subunit
MKHTLPNWLIQRATASVMTLTLLFGNTKNLCLSLSLIVFVHLSIGLQEILADYIHHEITRHLVSTMVLVFIIILIKYAQCFFLSF